MKDLTLPRPPGRDIDLLALHRRLAAAGLPVMGVSATPDHLTVHLSDEAGEDVRQAARALAAQHAAHQPVNRPMAVDLKQTIEHTREIRPLWQ